eukprot:scaffold126_cov315-Pavlova_lutheri.AAC.12
MDNFINPPVRNTQEQKAPQTARVKGKLSHLPTLIAVVGTAPLLLGWNPRTAQHTEPGRPVRCCSDDFPACPRTCPSRGL